MANEIPALGISLHSNSKTVKSYAFYCGSVLFVSVYGVFGIQFHIRLYCNCFLFLFYSCSVFDISIFAYCKIELKKRSY